MSQPTMIFYFQIRIERWHILNVYFYLKVIWSTFRSGISHALPQKDNRDRLKRDKNQLYKSINHIIYHITMVNINK